MSTTTTAYQFPTTYTLQDRKAVRAAFGKGRLTEEEYDLWEAEADASKPAPSANGDPFAGVSVKAGIKGGLTISGFGGFPKCFYAEELFRFVGNLELIHGFVRTHWDTPWVGKLADKPKGEKTTRSIDLSFKRGKERAAEVEKVALQRAADYLASIGYKPTE